MDLGLVSVLPCPVSEVNDLVQAVGMAGLTRAFTPGFLGK